MPEASDRFLNLPQLDPTKGLSSPQSVSAQGTESLFCISCILPNPSPSLFLQANVRSSAEQAPTPRVGNQEPNLFVGKLMRNSHCGCQTFRPIVIGKSVSLGSQTNQLIPRWMRVFFQECILDNLQLFLYRCYLVRCVAFCSQTACMFMELSTGIGSSMRLHEQLIANRITFEW
jgi:hypothetical protein